MSGRSAKNNAAERLNVSHVVRATHKPRRGSLAAIALREQFQHQAQQRSLQELRNLEKDIDAALGFDNNLDLAFDVLKKITERSVYRFHYGFLDRSEHEQMLDNEHIRLLKILGRAADRPWKTSHNPVYRTYTVLMEDTLALLFRCHENGSLEDACALVDYMDDRGRTKPAPISLNKLMSNTKGFPGELRRRADQVMPLSWVPRENSLNLLTYMTEKNSCLLPLALRSLPAFVGNIFSYFNSCTADTRDLKSVNVSSFSLWVRHEKLSTLPGQMRGFLQGMVANGHKQAKHAQEALAGVEGIMNSQFQSIERDRRHIRQKSRELRALWQPPQP